MDQSWYRSFCRRRCREHQKHQRCGSRSGRTRLVAFVAVFGRPDCANFSTIEDGDGSVGRTSWTPFHQELGYSVWRDRRRIHNRLLIRYQAQTVSARRKRSPNILNSDDHFPSIFFVCSNGTQTKKPKRKRKEEQRMVQPSVTQL